MEMVQKILFKQVKGCNIKVGIIDILLQDCVKILFNKLVKEKRIVVINKVMMIIS